MEKSTIETELKEPSEDVDDSMPPRFRRMLGSWIFESVGGFYLPTENVSKLSIKRQEQLLMRDLIYAFSGVPSSHIRPDISEEDISRLKSDNIEQVRFKIDENFSSAYRTLANELLPLIGYYINVQTFIEDTIMTTSCGRALGHSLHRHMQQYFDMQASLETQLQENKLNLCQLVQQLRPWLLTMQAYASLTSQVRRLEPNNAQLLSLMYEQTQLYKVERLKQLLSDVSRYYMKMVQLWTQKGVLYDMRGDFFIEDTRANAMSSTLLSPKQCCHSYWTQRYRLHKDRLPNFLAPLADMIFLAGKYLNVLRQCNVQMQLMQASLSFEPQNEQAHVQLIRSSYELPAGKLLEVLVQREQLEQHLYNLHGYFLLQDQDFALKLLDKCAAVLQWHVDDVLPEKLHKLLLNALQHSNDPHKHMLSSYLMNCDVATQLKRRFSRLGNQIEQEQEQSLRKSTSDTEASSDLETSSELPEQISLYGYEAFSLHYEPKWPISLVIHEEPLEQLQLLHRVLFYLRFVQQKLSSTWHKQDSSSALQQRMLEFINALEQHMSKDIINPSWQHLLSSLDKAQHVDELLTQFQSTLDQCLLLCLLSEPIAFVRSLYTLGQLCLNFCDFNEQLESTLQEYEEEFNNMLIGILELVTELSKPHSPCGQDERESCKQLLKRLEGLAKDLSMEQTSNENFI